MRQKLLLLGAVLFGLLAFVLTYRQLEAEKRRIMGDSETVVLIRITRNMVENEEIRETDVARYPVRRSREGRGFSRERKCGRSCCCWARSCSVCSPLS